MGFYFVVFVIFGLVDGSAVRSQKLAINPAVVPLWLLGGYGQIAISIAGLSWVLGAITILFQYSFYWMFISIAEVFLGAMLAVIFPARITFLILLLAPVISFVFLGALWGFWYVWALLCINIQRALKHGQSIAFALNRVSLVYDNDAKPIFLNPK